MDILVLADRFNHYAQINKDLLHDPDDPKEKPSFLECDIEDLQAAVKSGLKLPCLLFQTPTFDKNGNTDNITESIEGSFMILDKWKPGTRKLLISQKCKSISDEVIKYMIEDSETFFNGGLPETSEGAIGPLVDNLMGWAMNFTLTEPFDGEVDENKRRSI